jgi:EAL and modified HD-GYP domain-containing signal transduction protein
VSVFVARQPVFDRTKEVYGYELLFRAGLENCYDPPDADQSTLDVISNSFLVIGLDDLTDGKKGFINFTRNLLMNNVPSLLPKDSVVVEILEGIQPDEEILAACRKLKTSGYLLAMDDFVLAHRDSPFIQLADIVKVDFLGTSAEERKLISKYLTGKGVRVLAEKVEAVDEFDQALEMGYTYFQGYFFSKPVVRAGAKLSGNKLAYLRLLNEINKPDISYDDIEVFIKQDLSLTYKLLQFINSAWFGLKREIDSIKHALVLLGPKEIRKWFALVALRHMATDKPQELMLRSITRARLAEGMGPLVGMRDRGSELFLMGMFSVLDALMDVPMKDVLAKLPLNEEVKGALLGQPGRFRHVFDLMLSYEKGQWDDFSRHAEELQLDEELIPQLYTDALRWASQAFASA